MSLKVSLKALLVSYDEKYLPLSQVGIQFVQVGNDQQAMRYLAQLDDGLKLHGIRVIRFIRTRALSFSIMIIQDIVDTRPYNPDKPEALEAMLRKALLGSINRRVDKE